MNFPQLDRTELRGKVKPVIAFRIEGMPYDLEHGKHGPLFDNEDVDGLAEC